MNTEKIETNILFKIDKNKLLSFLKLRYYWLVLIAPALLILIIANSEVKIFLLKNIIEIQSITSINIQSIANIKLNLLKCIPLIIILSLTIIDFLCFTNNSLHGIYYFAKKMVSSTKYSIKKNFTVFTFYFITITIIAFLIPLHYDEIWTYLNISKKGFFNTIMYYPAPNNHILNSFLVYISTTLGFDTSLSIRFFPIIFSSILITFIFNYLINYLYLRKLQSFFLTLVFFFTPGIFLYLFQARGYYLQIICSAILTIILFSISKKDNYKITTYEYFLIIFYSLIGTISIPTFIYFVAIYFMLIILMTIKRNKAISIDTFKVILAAMITFFFIVILYLPLILVSGLGSITSNKFVIKFQFTEFIGKFSLHFIETFEFLYGYGIVLLIPILIYVFTIYNKKSKDYIFYYLLILSILPLCLLFFQKIIPFTRNWVYISSPIWLIIILFFSNYLKHNNNIKIKILLFTFLLLLGFSSYKTIFKFYSITNYKEMVCREFLNLENERNVIVIDDLWYHYAIYYNLKHNYNKNLKPGLFIYSKENKSNYILVKFDDTELDSSLKYREIYRKSNFSLLRIME